MTFIKGAFSAFPRTNITAEQLIRLYEHPSFGYDSDKLEKIKKIILSMKIESRPSYINFEQFWKDLDDDKCPCTIQRPSHENLFRSAEVPFRPTMGDRAKIWEEAVKELALRAAKGLIAKTRTNISEIDCVVTNTSSGVMLPNLSTWLPQQLGLTNHKCNLSVDNTGCNGAITCLDVARSAVLSGRATCVLIVTVDCSTPHMNNDPTLGMEGILPNLLFGDGAGAVLVTNKKEEGGWSLNEPTSILLGSETSEYISMRITENGYYLNLAKDLVPDLQKAMTERWSGLLKSITPSADPQEVEWLVHPGGKAILDSFTKLSPPLTPHLLRHSHKIMREKGNLVSATVIFVLELMLDQPSHQGNVACLVCPGPGIDIKIMTLDKVC